MSLTFLAENGHERLTVDNIGGTNGTTDLAGPLQSDEKLFGGGQRFDAVNRRGKRIEVWSEDRWCETEGNSYMPAPFTLSTAGYGWLVNRFEGMVIDLDGDRPGRWEVSGLEAPLDLYVFVDDDPRGILKSLTQLTGRAPVPPEWAFGVLVSRPARTKEFARAEGVQEMVRRMEEAHLPWSGVILEGWPAFDTTRYDELRDLVQDLHEKGKKAMVYEACGRLRSSLLEDPVAQSHCIKTEDGSTALQESPGFNPADAPGREKSQWVDITDPEAWRWWREEVWGVLLDDIGVDGAKIDFCEQVPEHDSIALSDGRSPRGLHHYYPVKYNTLMYRLFNDKRPEGGVCWSRGGGGIGGARYPWPWCGDQRREWSFLRAILRAALSSGLSGLPFMGHDLGGYVPAEDPEANPEPEVFARGCQLACFHPMMSTHGTVTRPYDFREEIVDIYRLYSRIHYALIPYLVEQADAGCAAGLPMLRHLVLHAPGDERAQECEDEHFLGEDLLVAPVLGPGEARNIYLPEGEWEELFEGTPHEGPAILSDFEAPLDRAPVFVRPDAQSSLLPDITDRIRELWQDR